MLHALNMVLAEGAQAASQISVQPDFTGHALCDPGPYVHGAKDPAPFHPMAAGQSPSPSPTSRRSSGPGRTSTPRRLLRRGSRTLPGRPGIRRCRRITAGATCGASRPPTRHKDQVKRHDHDPFPSPQTLGVAGTGRPLVGSPCRHCLPAQNISRNTIDFARPLVALSRRPAVCSKVDSGGPLPQHAAPHQLHPAGSPSGLTAEPSPESGSDSARHSRRIRFRARSVRYTTDKGRDAT